MNAFNVWARKNRETCIDLLRIYLGVLFVVKGFHLGLNRQELLNYLSEADLSGLPYFDAFELMAVHYTILAHIVGGVLLVLGLATRAAALFQLPAVLGAAILVHSGEHTFFGQALGLEYVSLLFFVLLFFFVYGSGALSLDALIKKKRVH
jgi:uncharacterized membrane protein YphA (DoxX/SURF4 family)